jgi:hypothetical protein
MKAGCRKIAIVCKMSDIVHLISLFIAAVVLKYHCKPFAGPVGSTAYGTYGPQGSESHG